jgi:Big-like domain-containing protein/IPT/TIG domain-containing protein
VRTLPACLAFGIAFAACGGKEPTEPPPTTSTVSISPDDPSLAVGTTVALAATARDAAGAVVPNRPVAWTTSAADVATVDPTSGVVTAVSAGFTVVRATIDLKFDQVLITVMSPVTSVEVTARRTTLGLNGTLQLTATTRDVTGTTLTGRAVTWSSSDETRARVSQTGVVTGVAAGNVTITATSEGVPGTIALAIADLPPLQISSVSPATLGPGVTATISGASFDANPADLDVTIAGIPVTVTAVTATQLTVQLPSFVPCQPTGNVTVSVTGAAGNATRAHPLQVARQRSVAVGDVLVLSGLDLRCNELPSTPARYALAVINSSRTPGATVGFEFRGLGGVATASAAPAIAAPLLTWASAGGPAMSLVSPLRAAATALRGREHMAWLERERQLARQLGGSPRRALRAAQMRAAAGRAQGAATTLSQRSAAPVPLEVGATTTLKIRTSDLNCTDSRDVPARVVYVGSKSVVLEATDAPLANTMDVDYVALGTEYDTKMHDVLLEHFGDPLAYDASTDANGRIVMLFTKAVNDRAANLLGFVTVCDFFAPTVQGASASNQAEIFYARVPTSTEINYNNINTRVGWMHNMRGTLIHEAKHIVAYAERFQTPVEADLEESWLEEGTAQAAIEFWGRATYYAGKATWKGNATYENTMRCDARPADAACGGQPSIIMDHFLFLFGYYENVETRSFFSSGRDDSSIYGSAWLLSRWAADHYATDEAAFYRSVTQSYTQTGLTNIEARIGRDYTSFHADFMMALYADDVSGLTPPASARYTIPSWNMRDMFLGISQNFTRGGEAVPAFPLRIRAAPFGAFTADVGSLLGGSAAYVELSGTPTAPQLLDLRAPAGLALPENSTLRLAVLRVQ